MNMTWGEFKKHVEAQGVTDQMEIWYIDFSFPSKTNLPQVHLPDQHDGVTIADGGGL